MRIFRHYQDIPAAYKGAVMALGNFDGVHRGHQALIGEAKRLADERKAPLAVLAFEPHPLEFFRPGSEIFRLTPFRTKARLIAGLGADAMFAIHFDATIASMTAQEFIDTVLVKGLGAGHIVVGPDFQFGKGRAGNVTLLSYMGAMEGFGVTAFPAVADTDGAKISSTRIRDALKAGKPEEAARLLGHSWSAEARVEHGDARGRSIGFPTANMQLPDSVHPAFGVYAVRATILEGEQAVGTYEGVANFGIRPMYKLKDPLLETFLFDFSGDLYGKHLSVEFVAYIRGEMKMAGLDALKAQIAKDMAAARAILASAR